MEGANKNTLHRLYGLLRQPVVALAEEEAVPFVGGTIEIDESYFGPRWVRGKRGRGAGWKIPVIGLRKRAVKLFAAPVSNCFKTKLLRVMHGQVKARLATHSKACSYRSKVGLVGSGVQKILIPNDSMPHR